MLPPSARGGGGGAPVMRRNIAQRKLLAREMASLEARKAAARAMTAYTLHEIRVPMQSLALGLQEIRYELEGCDACGRKAGLAEVLSCMHLASTQMERVMDSVLTWEKMEAGKFTLELAPMALSQLLKVAGMQIQRRAEEEGVVLTMDIDPRVPLVVLGDFHRLLQVLLNFLSNGIKVGCG
jgi:signal transduction histidine kinase